MTRLLLVRHGETDWNHISRVQGQTDVMLNDQGRRQAAFAGERLAMLATPAAIFASDLKRAWQTAEIIASHFPNLEIRPDPRLREIMLGVWEKRLWSEIEREEPALVELWRRDITAATPAGGETIEAMATRLQAFLEEVVKAYPDQEIIVVTHGGAIRMMITLALECPLRMSWRFGTDNASIADLTLSPSGPFLVRLNDTTHLQTEG